MHIVIFSFRAVGNLLIYCNVIKNAPMCSNVYSKNLEHTFYDERGNFTLLQLYLDSIALCIGIKLSLSLKIGLRLNTSVSYFKVLAGRSKATKVKTIKKSHYQLRNTNFQSKS